MRKRDAEHIVAAVEADDTEVIRKPLNRSSAHISGYRTASGEIISDWDYRSALTMLKEQPTTESPDSGGRPPQYLEECGYAQAIYDSGLGKSKSGTNTYEGAADIVCERFKGLNKDNFLRAWRNWRGNRDK
jgi:hypothetical protein